MEDKVLKDVFKSIIFVTVGLILLVAVLTIIPNIFIAQNNDWIGFYGAIFGSLLGGYITFIGINLTLKNGKQVREDDLRLQLRPYITADVSDFYSLKKTDKGSVNIPGIKIKFKNIGMNSCINLYSIINMFDSSGEITKAEQYLFMYNSLSRDEVTLDKTIEVGLDICQSIEFTVYFDDLEDRSYSQSVVIDFSYFDTGIEDYNKIRSLFVSSSKPKLISEGTNG